MIQQRDFNFPLEYIIFNCLGISLMVMVLWKVFTGIYKKGKHNIHKKKKNNNDNNA